VSLLTHNELLELVISGVLENSAPEHVNAASIDIRMGDSLLVEQPGRYSWCDLSKKQVPPMRLLEKDADGGWSLYPGDFALVNTMEVFHLPADIAAEYKLKSSLARAGLNHMLAGWVDPGFHDATLTLELKNELKHTILKLHPGMKIGQMVFWRGEPVPAHASYAARGQYNGQKDATPSRGLR